MAMADASLQLHSERLVRYILDGLEGGWFAGILHMPFAD
jgi:hypothetical protein